MKYKMTITDGGGTETDGGDFEIVETPKTLTFKCVRQPFFSNRMSGKKAVRINKYYPKKYPRKDGRYEAWREIEHITGKYVGYFNNGHVARKWEDGTWTVYPNQEGVPHFLEKI